MEWGEAPTDAHVYQSASQLNELYNGSQIKTDAQQGMDVLAVRYHADRRIKPKTAEKHRAVKFETYPRKAPSVTAAGLTRPVHVLQRKRGVFGS